MNADVVVIGGGVGGLAAAALTAQSGARTVLVERGRLGGRARSTSTPEGHVLNLGPHALYLGGPAQEVLDDLGVEWHGGKPTAQPRLVLVDGDLHPFPETARSMATASWLPVRARVDLARILSRVALGRPGVRPDETFGAWVARQTSDPTTRSFLLAVMRVTTYNADPAMSAAAATAQVRQGLIPGVRYVDGGWQRLVDGLATRASANGARLRTGVGPVTVDRSGQGWSVHTAGTRIEAEQVIAAVGGPSRIISLLGEHLPAGTRTRLQACSAVRAAVLDVALSRPIPEASFVLGVGEPVYLSVHSDSADLAPEGHSVVHLARYLDPGSPGGQASAVRCRAQLEELLTFVHPTWRDEAVSTRFLPAITVAHDLVAAGTGGLHARVDVEQTDGLFLVGDWVGPTGLLTDAVLASARTAAARASADVARVAAAVA